MRAKDVLGRWGEDVAARHLRDAGMEVLDRNWRCRDGELDIVALEGKVLVVCEVKTRSGRYYGSGLEAVTAAKAARLRRLAACWLVQRDRGFVEVRFDVVAVQREAGGGFHVEHSRAVI